MILFRILLILVLGLATALSGLAVEQFATGAEHPHPAAVELAASGDQDGDESSHDIVQPCHHVQGLDRPCDPYDGMFVIAEDSRFYVTYIAMTDASLTGPLKPPRLV